MSMPWLQNLPIKLKLNLVILLTCSAVLLLACGALAAYDLYQFRGAMVHDMTMLADVLAKNTRAALQYQDDNTAREILKALQSEPYVMAAAIYTPNGARFADYSRSPATPFPLKPTFDGYHFENGALLLYRPVILDGKRVGTIYLQGDLSGLRDRLRVFGGIALLVLLGALLVAYFLASQLQRSISRPILDLAETARSVADKKDYSVRAVPHGRDETGLLTDSFNQMLAGIEERDGALRSTNEALRGEILERKGAEARVQSQLARLKLLNQITRAIGERQNLQSIFSVVIRNIEEHLPVDFSSICLHEHGSSITVACIGNHNRALAAELGMAEQSQIPIDQNGLAHCLRGELVHEPDTAKVQFAFPQQLARGGLRSMVIAPLLVESRVFGLLLAARREPGSFSSGECEFLQQLSEHVALAAHQAQLNTALQQAYDDLRQTQQTVMQQERLRALGQMASGIAHDINNAISPVALYTESLLEKEPNLSARTRGYLETIQHAVEDVAATVARMREFYRQREPQLDLVPVNLNRLLQQVIDLSRARWSDMPQQRGLMIKLVTEFAPDLPVIRGVESEIREAFINLIFNAVDAMPEGGTLTLRTRIATHAPASAENSSLQYLWAEVVDSGIGMSEEVRRHCLEPFYTTKGERGTGLGLAMVYGVVQRHGADIEIESAQGKGTTVRLAFPVPPTPVAGTPEKAAAFSVPLRLRILIVDDDPLLLKSLRDTLEVDGHVVVAANGGQAGIDAFRTAQARSEPFAIVITDLGMPYVDGRKVANEIKGMSPTTPIILLTGWGQRLIIEGDVPPHVDRVLNKPPKLREVREAIAACANPATSKS